MMSQLTQSTVDLACTRPHGSLHGFRAVPPNPESQRDSATKPRVASIELPWVNTDDEFNPGRVMARGYRENGRVRNPVEVVVLQNWAWLRPGTVALRNWMTSIVIIFGVVLFLSATGCSTFNRDWK